MVVVTPAFVRFYRFVAADPSGCLLWTGHTNGKKTYGRFDEARKHTVTAHRWIYEQTCGPIPEGLQLDHLCNTTLCVNVDHLEVVTNLENQQRKVSRKKEKTI